MLYHHQVTILDETDELNRVAYYMDMGLGKTFVGTEKMNRLNCKNNLVVCQKSKIKDWIDHLNQYSRFKVYDLTKHLKDYLEYDGQKVGVINYDLVWRRPELSGFDGCLMLDESSEIQNDKAKRTKFILKLKPTGVILLSGTPVGGRYENLWSQLHLLGYDISKSAYDSMYVNFYTLELPTGQYVKMIDKKTPYKNVERLKRKLREHGAVFQKTEEVFDLPDQNFQTVRVGTPKGYKKFLKEDYLMIGNDELVADCSLTKLLGCRKLCGIYSKEKQEAMKDLLNSTNDRLVIFYNFNAELELLKEICKDRPISEVNGHLRDLNAFENEDNSVTLVQYQAGAKGLNLQKANKIVYFTLPLSSENFEQSKKRIHRIGQDKPCYYYILECAGTIEEDILESLHRKQDFTDDLFREVIESGRRKKL